MIKICLTALAVFMLFTSNVFAHDLWLEKTGGKLVLMYGHPDRLETYNPEWVKDVRGYDRFRKKVPLVLKQEEGKVSFISKREPAMLSLLLDSGYWTKTVDGLRNVSKRGVTDYIEACHYVEPVKGIFRWSERFTAPIGTRLEIVPQKNPLKLKQGENLPIKVLFEGKPLAGAVITANGELTGMKSGKDGAAMVMIEGKGLHIFAARHKVRLKDDPDADTLVLRANLSFEVK
jgi:nickel transport protein